jgi:hypothetical protein
MSIGADPRTAGRDNGRRQQAIPQSRTFRQWKGLNLADSRLTIDDDELYWRDNVMPVGRGQQSVPIYAGPAGAVLHADTVKDTWGGMLTFPGEQTSRPVFVAVFMDGSAFQRDYSVEPPLDRQIAPPGTFAAGSRTGMTPWQDGPLLILDAKAGYGKWDGVAFTVMDATRRGAYLAVFEGHAWLVLGARTIDYTAPETFDDFAPNHGAGTFRITDEAFEGPIYQLLSFVQQLWVFGADAINAIGNVQTTGGVTTFAVTNAVDSLGSTFANSVIGYYRTLAFATSQAIAGLTGVQPQNLSQKITRLASRLGVLTPTGPRAGTQKLYGMTVLCFLVDYDDPIQAKHRPLLLCYVEGQWFLASPPSLVGNQRVLNMATVIINATPELYGIDEGGHVFRIFARSTDPMGGLSSIFFKLYELGAPTSDAFGLRVGVDLTGPADVATAHVSIAAITETSERARDYTVKMLNAGDAPLGTRIGLLRRNVDVAGERVGVTITMQSAERLCVEALHLQLDQTEPFVSGGTR